MMADVIIAPSLLSCDFARIAEEVKAVEQAGADWLHIDVMDGHFVPNLTIGPAVVSAIKKVASVPLDVHLMISNPDDFIEQFVDAGSDYLTVHYEACTHLHRTLTAIKHAGAIPGVSLNPATPPEMILPVLSEIELILFMTVNPGFGGQDFIPSVLDKVGPIKSGLNELGKGCLLAVDGGINEVTAPAVIKKGINVLVAGSYIFGSPDYRKAIDSLR
ncbi:MAG: ribulose-phosphate 3-epimerase [candidate division Zixibacteria bacterium]|nr:ribulose-phosphate 3-epimerase [candidate division Zixibacteria bacterium]